MPSDSTSELCFQAGLTDQGMVALRQALRVAPRDASVRDALAHALAEHDRIDEAIQLRWQSLEMSTNLDQQRQIVSSLVSLHSQEESVF